MIKVRVGQHYPKSILSSEPLIIIDRGPNGTMELPQSEALDLYVALAGALAEAALIKGRARRAREQDAGVGAPGKGCGA